MSLFGESPPRASKAKSNLFDDEQLASAARGAGGGLFADDTHDSNAVNSSPWDMPTPKKNARRNLVRSLLPATDVPEFYTDAFDALLERESGASGATNISVDTARSFVQEGRVARGDVDKIIEIVAGGGATTLGRAEFNVLVALVGLAQEGEELSLDAVDERRKRLPIPNMPSLKPQKSTQPSLPQKSTDLPQSGSLESDPWSGPDLHKDHDHAQQGRGSSYTNGGNTAPMRTTSQITTASTGGASLNAPSFVAETTQPGGGWGGDTGFAGAAAGAFDGSHQSHGDVDDSGAARPAKSIGVGKRTGSSIEEEVTVNLLDEKEGMFLFQHRNYEVSSVRKNSKVIRRYSDFVWLLDCLHKRYPFRQLPLLPPKRVAINGNHLAGDASFLEKRRRGLARFSNALVRHPILGQEQLVVMFLTVPTELAVWRKQATISVQEEFTGKQLPSGLEESLPTTLPELFDKVRVGIRRSAEIYINLCNAVEKLSKYNFGLANEYTKLSTSLESAAEASEEVYAVDTNDVPLLNDGIRAVSKHLSTNRQLLEDEGRAWDLGALEDFKRQRDAIVSMRDMFDRRDRYAKDNIPQLERRIENNENKLGALRLKIDAKPSDIEKLEDLIIKDKQSIVEQHARGVFIKDCILDELKFFNKSQYHVSRMHQEWSQERIKYSELSADNWRGLVDEIESMPTSE